MGKNDPTVMKDTILDRGKIKAQHSGLVSSTKWSGKTVTHQDCYNQRQRNSQTHSALQNHYKVYVHTGKAQFPHKTVHTPLDLTTE
jgi:hypothetical protein